MLRISKLADYGTVAMVYLAKHAEILCNARDIAAHTHLSVPTVSKLLKKLAGAKLLISVRGVSGGYRLARDASLISVADILYALEEPRGLTECAINPQDCFLHGVCHIKGNWKLISKAIESALASVSLDALAKPKFEGVDVQPILNLASGVSRV